jgi:CRISPR/Cas system-associated exonuclease Cas4 (RecB family)
MLERRYQKYTDWDRVNNAPRFLPDYQTIAVQMAKEILIPSFQVILPNSNRPQIISASSLANFTFCPASYAIQETYDLRTSLIGNIGSLLHDKQLLVSKKVEETKEKFFRFAEKGDFKYIDSLSIDKRVKDAIQPLLREIASSKLVFHGHNTSENNMFFDDAGTLVGCPDYIFERSDGTRFIVEEKFSYQKRHSTPPSSPYVNHRMQLGTYTMLLKGTEAPYGYLLYWSYSLQEGYPQIIHARAFMLESTRFLREEVLAKSSQMARFRNEGARSFDMEALNLWKCVNCVTTEICGHKTGTLDTLRLPYNGFNPQKLPDSHQYKDSVFNSLSEAKPFAQKYGRSIIRNPSGSGFILK